MDSKPEKTPNTTKYALVAISLANLIFVPAWRAIFQNPAELYYFKTVAGWTALIAIVIDILIAAAVFYGLAVLLERSTHPVGVGLGRAAFVVVAALGLGNCLQEATQVRDSVARRLPTGLWMLDSSPEVFTGIVLLVVTPILAIVIWKRAHIAGWTLRAIKRGAIVQWAIVALIVLSPIGLVLCVNMAMRIVALSKDPAFSSNPSPRSIPAPDKRLTTRVVWVVFDEWDQGLTFDARPPDVGIPEITRLRSESLCATHASSPSWETKESLPSFVTGYSVFDSEPTAPDKLRLSFSGRPVVYDWKKLPNIFDDVQSLGGQSSIVGWYHPYGRLFGESVSSISWTPVFFVGRLFPENDTIWGWMTQHSRLACQTVPYLQENFFFSSVRLRTRRYSIKAYHQAREAALAAASDPNVNLVFLHMPIPHPPGIFDRTSGEFSASLDRDYIDNIALVDRTIGELRQRLEQEGLWDQTTVLLSSDHPSRPMPWDCAPVFFHETEAETAEFAKDRSERYVPFLLKLAGHTDPVEYDGHFNTVLSKDLIEAILRGEVQTPAQAAEFIERTKDIPRPMPDVELGVPAKEF